jgi:hypothetical protein
MKPTTLERQAQNVERWKSDRGITGRDYVPVNGGARRTESKRTMLSSLSDAAAARGRPSRFPAKY